MTFFFWIHVVCTVLLTFDGLSGNYGNQLDVSVPPSASSTSPTNAIFDGTFYYFLPWNDIKPCCNVDSHWEDIAFRLEPLNILSRMREQLVSISCTPCGCPAERVNLIPTILLS